MHNFRELVARRREEDPREREIVSELADHLEETYLDLLHSGVSEGQALALVSAMGEKLGPTVRRLRWQRDGGVKIWLRAVVLPGLILALFYGACNIALGVYWEYMAVWREAGLVLTSIALGFCASSFSRELGGRLAHRLWAALVVVSLQAAPIFIMVFLYTPVELVHNAQYRGSGTISGILPSLISILLWDLVMPVVGSAIGAAISVHAFSDSRKSEVVMKAGEVV